MGEYSLKQVKRDKIIWRYINPTLQEKESVSLYYKGQGG
jgi:hypothetical protein